MATERNELFVVERSDGEWIDNTGDVDYSVFTSRAEAQDALEAEADNAEDANENYKIIRFQRVGEEQA